jgi:HEAT repeat protein
MRIVSRATWAVPSAAGLAALLCLVGAAPAAFAHGGRFVPPQPPPFGGPPGETFRDPYAPPTPGTTTPGSPSPINPPATTPSAPLGGPRAAGPRTSRGDPRTGWREWWDANEDSIRAGRRLRPFVTEDNPLFRIGGDEEGNRSDGERPARRAIETEILPVLRSNVDTTAKIDSDVLAASLLAIGKLTNDPADVERLLAAGARRTAPDLVRESALLSLGLLRRTPTADRFGARLLDPVRQRLFEALDDDSIHVRGRCYAAFALGLLGDQPSGDDEYSCDGRQTVRGIWTRLSGRFPGDDIPVALLTALSLQPPRGIPDAVKADLRALCVSGRLAGHSYGALARAHAVIALARLDGAAHAATFIGMAKSRSFDVQVRRSAISALGLVAASIDSEQRSLAVATLLEVGRSGDPDTAGLAVVTVGRLLHADFAAGSGAAAERSRAADALVRFADAGAHDVRPFGALALAIAGRGDGNAPDVPAFVDLHGRAVEALREGATSERGDPDIRGAYCVALGLLGDVRSAAALRNVITKTSLPEDLRGYACVGLGLLGRPSPEGRAALRLALEERSETLRRQSARALGLLGDTSAVPMLLKDLEAGGPDHVVARVALSLGDVKDVSAVKPLVRLVRDARGANATRAIACAALGLLADLEPMPSLSRLGTDGNPLARTDALNQALALL